MPSPGDDIHMLTQHNDNSRTGANLSEFVLNTSNVNQEQFGKLFECMVDGQMYAQPLCVSNLTMPNGDKHNVVYVATMHNSVYAFDADDPSAAKPLWKTSLGPAVSLPDPNIGPNGYRDIAVEVGIVGTPVISLDHNVLYAVAITKVNNVYAHRLHALDLGTGAEELGGPRQVGAVVPGRGDGSVKGQVTFTSNRQIQRAALLLAKDIVYIAFAAYGDQSPYHGWVFAYNAATLQRMAVYNTTPNGRDGGIWQAAQGPAADSDNNIYILTGNGTFKADGSALGDSFIKLSPNLKLLDWFTPYNNAALDAADADVGSAGAMVIPETNLLLGGGKESKFYLLERNRMGHFNAANNNQIVQSFYVNSPDNPQQPLTMAPGHTHHIHGGPVYWKGPNGTWIYVWTENDCLKAYQLVNGRFQTTPMKCTTIPASDCVGMPGGTLSISANADTPGTGIVWASHPHNQKVDQDANQHVVGGILRAYDATDLTKELWNSEQNSSRDSVGNFAKFCSPTIANGKVYMASFGRGVGGTDKSSYHLTVYGLLP